MSSSRLVGGRRREAREFRSRCWAHSLTALILPRAYRESKGTVRERASSPAVGQPETKRPRQEEEKEVTVAEPIVADAAASAPAAEEETPVIAEEEEVNEAALPAEIVGANFSRGPGEFKEEPFIYLSPEDEQVKLIACVVSPLLLCARA